jgi:hypothetical protein
MFVVGIELFFGFVAGALILCMGLAVIGGAVPGAIGTASLFLKMPQYIGKPLLVTVGFGLVVGVGGLLSSKPFQWQIVLASSLMIAVITFPTAIYLHWRENKTTAEQQKQRPLQAHKV